MPDTVNPLLPGRQRVLLVGEGVYDGVVDSYRRALTAHYDVEVFDPYAVLGRLGDRLGPVWGRRLVGATTLLSRSFLREPLALSEPRLMKFAREFAADLVLVTCIAELRPHVVAGLRAGNPRCKVFGVFSDAIVHIGRGYFFAADYDALFFKDHYIVDKLRTKLGWTHVHYLPQACDRVLRLEGGRLVAA